MKKKVIIYGKHAVEGALLSKTREIYEILVAFGVKFNVPPEFAGLTRVSSEYEISKTLAGRGKDIVHQGVLAVCSPIRSKSLKEINLTKEKSLALILDSLTDVTNIGTIIRSACAFKVDFLLYHKTNMPEITTNEVVIKNSCGGIENVPIVSESNLANALAALKKNGYWIIGMEGEGGETLSGFIHKNSSLKKIALILGSEGKGMRGLTKNTCDFLIKIEISKKMESLNVGSAAAIALYEFSKALKT